MSVVLDDPSTIQEGGGYPARVFAFQSRQRAAQAYGGSTCVTGLLSRLGSFPNREPQYIPQFTIVLIIGTPKRVALLLGKKTLFAGSRHCNCNTTHRRPGALLPWQAQMLGALYTMGQNSFSLGIRITQIS